MYQETSFRLRQTFLLVFIAGCYIGVGMAGLKNPLGWLRLACAPDLHAFNKIVILLWHLWNRIHKSIFKDPFKRISAWLCNCDTRDSVTDSTLPISFIVSSS